MLLPVLSRSGLCACALTAALLINLPGTASAQEWGDLTGRFVYDGKPPAPVKCNVVKDQEVCTKHHPLVEDVVVDENGGLANIVVWVRTADVKVHSDYENPKPASSNNENCRFDPHIIPVRTGQTLVLSNSDPVNHNTQGLCRSNPQFNDNIPPGGTKEIVFDSGERLPVPISCAIHPWMTGYLVIQDHPYVAVSAKDGTFRIAKLPAGVELEFQVWQETSGYVDQVSKGGEALPWTRGRFTMTLESGENDLGELRVSPELFQP